MDEIIELVAKMAKTHNLSIERSRIAQQIVELYNRQQAQKQTTCTSIF